MGATCSGDTCGSNLDACTNFPDRESYNGDMIKESMWTRQEIIVKI